MMVDQELIDLDMDMMTKTLMVKKMKMKNVSILNFQITQPITFFMKAIKLNSKENKQ
jgi:hypothetical protein